MNDLRLISSSWPLFVDALKNTQRDFWYETEIVPEILLPQHEPVICQLFRVELSKNLQLPQDFEHWFLNYPVLIGQVGESTIQRMYEEVQRVIECWAVASSRTKTESRRDRLIFMTKSSYKVVYPKTYTIRDPGEFSKVLGKLIAAGKIFDLLYTP